MLPETESALAGFARGAIQGAALAFFVVGAIGVLAAAGGLIPGIVLGATIQGGFFTAFVKAVGAFLLCGACGAPFGAVLGAGYEAYNEFLEEREVQKHIKHAKEVVHNSELYDIMHSTEKMPMSFEKTVAAAPLEQSALIQENSAVERLNAQRAVPGNMGISA